MDWQRVQRGWARSPRPAFLSKRWEDRLKRRVLPLRAVATGRVPQAVRLAGVEMRPVQAESPGVAVWVPRRPQQEPLQERSDPLVLPGSAAVKPLQWRLKYECTQFSARPSLRGILSERAVPSRIG